MLGFLKQSLFGKKMSQVCEYLFGIQTLNLCQFFNSHYCVNLLLQFQGALGFGSSSLFMGSHRPGIFFWRFPVGVFHGFAA